MGNLALTGKCNDKTKMYRLTIVYLFSVWRGPRFKNEKTEENILELRKVEIIKFTHLEWTILLHWSYMSTLYRDRVFIYLCTYSYKMIMHG